MTECDFECDLAIVGGGPVGAALALALRGSGLNVALFEARPASAPVSDTRTLALSHGSRLILERLGVWRQLHATPIAAIHVSQRARFGRALLTAQELRLPALGYVLTYAELHHALLQALATSNIVRYDGAKVTCGEPHHASVAITFEQDGASHTAAAKLLAVADGGRAAESLVDAQYTARDYGQYAVVAIVATELPHRNIAYERFTESGPAALLPVGSDFALVWTATPEQAAVLCQLEEHELLDQLHRHFGDRLGQFTRVGPRASFPLWLKYAASATGERSVLVGNASQTLHPVAGQGFNLGLRDAWELAETILACPPQQIGSPAMLDAYRMRRQSDRGMGIYFTDALARLFAIPDSPLRGALGLGISALDCLPPARRLLARRMIFGAAG